MFRKIVSGLFALVAIASTEQNIQLQQFEPQHVGTPVPVTVYENDGDWTEYKYNYHSNKYYRSNYGTAQTANDQDYSFSWSMYDAQNWEW